MKLNIILAALAGAAFAAVTVFAVIDKNEMARLAEELAFEEETESVKPKREVEKTAVITVTTKDKNYTGHVEEDYFVIDYCGIDADTITVPEEIEGYPVKKLGKLSFARRFCKNIVLPDSIEEIGERAFINCEGLESIKFGSGLKKMGGEALKSCHVLKEVTFPDGMAELADIVFAENEKLTVINIPGKDTKIGNPAEFETCPKAVIVTPAGSQADKIAREKKLPVENR